MTQDYQLIYKKLSMNKIFVISGPAGVGKGTIEQVLLTNHKLNLIRGTTYTTRPPRPSDVAERHYEHVSENEFKELKQKGEIFEANFFNQHWYGSSKKLIEESLKTGANVLVEVDVNGGFAYKKAFGDKTVLIFISAPINDIKKRIKSRGQNTSEQIVERLEIAKKELQAAKNYDHVVENPQDNPQQAIDKIIQIIYNSLQ